MLGPAFCRTSEPQCSRALWLNAFSNPQLRANVIANVCLMPHCRTLPLDGIVSLNPSLFGDPYSNAKMRFQSFFMLMTVQPSFFASS